MHAKRVPALNLIRSLPSRAAAGIVFANKLVFTSFGFHFTCALTLIHTLFTLAGMHVCLALGVFEAKRLPANRLLPLSSAYVAYIVLCNLSLKVNTVGFYQVRRTRCNGRQCQKKLHRRALKALSGTAEELK